MTYVMPEKYMNYCGDIFHHYLLIERFIYYLLVIKIMIDQIVLGTRLFARGKYSGADSPYIEIAPVSIGGAQNLRVVDDVLTEVCDVYDAWVSDGEILGAKIIGQDRLTYLARLDSSQTPCQVVVRDYTISYTPDLCIRLDSTRESPDGLEEYRKTVERLTGIAGFLFEKHNVKKMIDQEGFIEGEPAVFERKDGSIVRKYLADL